MYIKFTSILIISILSNLVSFAQDPYFSNYSVNLIYMNPAFVSSVNDTEASVTYRNQWPGLRDAFVAYGASVSVPMIKYQSGLGFYFLNDVQAGGVITSTSANSTYAYKIKINPNIYLNAGLGASYNLKNLNADDLIFESDLTSNQGINGEQDIYENAKSTFWDFSLGFLAQISEVITVGLSVQHVTQPKSYFSSADNNVLFRSYTLHASGNIPLGGMYKVNSPVLTPSILIQKCKQHNQFVYGSGLSLPYFSFGLWVKNNYKFSFCSLTASAGFVQANYRLIYSYDINLTRANFMSYNMGAHEATFLLMIKHREKRRKNRAIK
jgi:type IX secretion system PorP/SprF family membrane protein